MLVHFAQAPIAHRASGARARSLPQWPNEDTRPLRCRKQHRILHAPTQIHVGAEVGWLALIVSDGGALDQDSPGPRRRGPEMESVSRCASQTQGTEILSVRDAVCCVHAPASPFLSLYRWFRCDPRKPAAQVGWLMDMALK